MSKPHSIIRLSKLSEVLPLGRTARDDLIKRGLLKVVPLTPAGRAKGVTLASVVAYQRNIMNLEPLSDGDTSEPSHTRRR
jgi:hypothetical protein